MLRESVEWRNSQGVYKLSITTHPFIETSLARANMYMNGRDKGGRPIIVLRPNIYHDPHSSEEKLFFMCYALEQAFRTMEPHIYQMTWVCSLDGYSMKHNGDLKFARELLNMLQNHNPERLGQAFFLDVPFLFRAAWKAMSPFIDEKTKSKVHFVANSNRTEYLAKYIDLDVLEACFGGTNRFQIDHHQYVKKMLDLEGVDHSTFKSTFGTEAPPKPRYSKTATNDIDPAEAAAARANLEKDAPDAAAEAEADAAAASAE
ncbi:hypothetical protein, variant [Capsaspora owczarzaki ATCC 30864]|nr:hypothetical protein, variant [Capsaspora owczarzaki ATCC 30864]